MLSWCEAMHGHRHVRRGNMQTVRRRAGHVRSGDDELGALWKLRDAHAHVQRGLHLGRMEYVHRRGCMRRRSDGVSPVRFLWNADPTLRRRLHVGALERMHRITRLRAGHGGHHRLWSVRPTHVWNGLPMVCRVFRLPLHRAHAVWLHVSFWLSPHRV
jgi:hypothetical protein